MTNSIGPKNLIGENGNISSPPPKKVPQSPIENLAKNHLTQQSSIDVLNPEKAQIVASPVSVKEDTEKVQMQIGCPTNEGTLENTTIVFSKVDIQNESKEESNEDPEVDEFEDNQDDEIADFDLVKKAEVEVQMEAKEVQIGAKEVQKDKDRGLEKVDQTAHEVRDSKVEVSRAKNQETEKLDEISNAREKATQDLQSKGIIFDHYTKAGDTGYVIAKRVNVNDESFSKRLEAEKQRAHNTSVDKIFINPEEVEEFSRGIGLLKSRNTAALPPEILARFPPGTKVILLDDLPVEMRSQVDDLIAQNKLPTNIPVRIAIAMTPQDQKTVQKMVAHYFTLSVKLHVLQTLAQRNALQTTAQQSTNASKPVTDDNFITQNAPEMKTTVPKMEQKKEKEVKKQLSDKSVQKAMILQSQARSQMRKKAEKKREQEGAKNAQDILQVNIKYFIRLGEQKIYNLNRLQAVAKELNYALKKTEDKLSDEEIAVLIKIAQGDITKEGMKFVDILSYVRTLLKNKPGLAYNNEKIFPSIEKEGLFIEKLDRFLRIYGQ
jgi:hypothetical protein